jgi:hypothetical protein
MSAYADSRGYAVYFTVSDISNPTSIYAHYNESNMIFNYVDGNNSSTIKMEYNYIHDNSYAIGISTYKCASVVARNNYFKNLKYGIQNASNTVQVVQSNVFYRCVSAGVSTSGYVGGFSDLYNVFVECGIGYQNAGMFTTMSNLVMVNCTKGISVDVAITVTLTNSIRYNSPNGGTGYVLDSTGIVNENPNFRNPYLDDYSWDGSSVLEGSPAIIIDNLHAFINPTGYGVSFGFMTIQGPIAGKALASDYAGCSLTYSKITGAQVGINETVYTVTETSVLLTGNGIGARLANAGVHTNVIAVQNNVGLLVRGPSALINVTCTENAWGVSTSNFGF